MNSDPCIPRPSMAAIVTRILCPFLWAKCSVKTVNAVKFPCRFLVKSMPTFTVLCLKPTNRRAKSTILKVKIDIIESVEQLAADVMLRRERRNGSHPCGRLSHIHVVAINLIESATIATVSCLVAFHPKNKIKTHDDKCNDECHVDESTL